MTKQSKFVFVLLVIVVLVAGGILWQLNQQKIDEPPSLDTSQELLQGKIEAKDIYYQFTNSDVERFNADSFNEFVELSSSKTNYVRFMGDMPVSEIFAAIEPKIGMEANIGTYNLNSNCIEGVEDGFHTFKTKSSTVIKESCPVMININANTRIGAASIKPISEKDFESELLSLTSGEWALVWTSTPNEETTKRIVGGIENNEFTVWTLNEKGDFVSNLNSDIPVAWIKADVLALPVSETVTASDSFVVDFANVEIVNEDEDAEKASKKSGYIELKGTSYFQVPAKLNPSQELTLLAAVMFYDYEGGSILEFGGHELYNDPNNWLTFKYEQDKKFVVNQDKPAAPALNKWHLVVGVYKDGEAKLYVDGEEMNSRQREGTLMTSGEMIIGGKGLNGAISDLRIFNKALTAEEVASLYEGIK